MEVDFVAQAIHSIAPQANYLHTYQICHMNFGSLFDPTIEMQKNTNFSDWDPHQIDTIDFETDTNLACHGLFKPYQII